MSGSLLCLSSDNCKNLLFVVVVNREVENLKKGSVLFGFLQSYSFELNRKNIKYSVLIFL